MTADKEMKEMNAEMMELICGGFGCFNPLFHGIPPYPPFVPERPKDEPRDGGATGGWSYRPPIHQPNMQTARNLRLPLKHGDFFLI